MPGSRSNAKANAKPTTASVAPAVHDCTSFAAGTGPPPTLPDLVTLLRAAKPEDAARLAAVALCAAVVAHPRDVITLIGAVRTDHARSTLFSDAIRMDLLQPEHTVAAVRAMDPSGRSRTNVLCDFLRLDGAAQALTWHDVNEVAPDIGTTSTLNAVVISAVKHRILTDWPLAWSLSACADAMGQRQVACAAIDAGIAPTWGTLHEDLEQIGRTAQAQDGPGWLGTHPEQQRALVVIHAIHARILADTEALTREVRRALGANGTEPRTHELRMLLLFAEKYHIPLPAAVLAEAEATLRARHNRPPAGSSNPTTPSAAPRTPRTPATPQGQLPLFA